MKALLAISIASATTTLGASAQALYDSFDYGAGIPGRSAITAGDLFNNIKPLTGSTDWTAIKSNTATAATFGGSPGYGNGELDLTTLDGNSSVKTKLDFSSGTVEATLNFTMTSTASPGNSAGIYLGFHSATPDNNLLINQKSDNVMVQIATNSIKFRTRLGGSSRAGKVTGEKSQEIKSQFDKTWTPRATGRLHLSYNRPSGTMSAQLISEGQELFNDTISLASLSLEPGYQPNFNMVSIQSLVMDRLTVQDVKVSIPEPQTYQLALGIIALALTARRRRNR